MADIFTCMRTALRTITTMRTTTTMTIFMRMIIYIAMHMGLATTASARLARMRPG